MRFHRKLSVVFFITALIFYLPNFILTSCAQTSSAPGESSTGFSQTAPGSEAASVTYEFPDLPIPIELERVEDRTIMIKTVGFQGGILVFKGRVTVVSLMEFFTKSMPRHGWVLDGTLNAKRSFLAFSKERNAYCLIQIYEAQMGFKTEVQIWVSEPLAQ
jgi:hypothetical protein